MSENIISVQPAPAGRASSETLIAQRQLLEQQGFLPLFRATAAMLMILNAERQIILFNPAVRNFLSQNSPDGSIDDSKIFGHRPGEAINCSHSKESEGGCGTTESCSTCGTLKAILKAQDKHESLEEARLSIRTADEFDSMELKIAGSPLEIGKKCFTLISLSDVSEEKRRKVLERIFFHDITNTAGNIRNIVDMLLEETDPDFRHKFLEVLELSSRNLLDEISSQRELFAAENNELTSNFSSVSTKVLLENSIQQYSKHEVAQGRHIRLASLCEDITFLTDPVLLRRVLGNMIKNALEAAAEGMTITVGVHRITIAASNFVEFSVHNPSFMPRPVQLQIFQRSFSTRGNGRGLGTYSMKLISERCLKGTVAFESDERTGTTFYARYPFPDHAI
ncbi:MAG: GHKL domain-containing protein [Candidatus Riflebacteria bacterium]|nr:GHKL domain-containing protein [Candidatus Riflebacteria bacterium]